MKFYKCITAGIYIIFAWGLRVGGGLIWAWTLVSLGAAFLRLWLLLPSVADLNHSPPMRNDSADNNQPLKGEICMDNPH